MVGVLWGRFNKRVLWGAKRYQTLTHNARSVKIGYDETSSMCEYSALCSVALSVWFDIESLKHAVGRKWVDGRREEKKRKDKNRRQGNENT